VTWLGTVGIESIRVAIVCGGRSCNGAGRRYGAADGLFEPHTAAA
jgi:hypothetical protein